MLDTEGTIVDAGVWRDGGVGWELHSSSILPSPEDCTAAFCVAITRHGKIVLAREERGWGMIGGHIEDHETIEQALVRECLEEGGFIVTSPVLFGYRKIIASQPVAHPTPGKAYPFPVSYIAYYYATTDKELSVPTEREVLEIREFTIEQIITLGIPDCSTIKLGWECHLSELTQGKKIPWRNDRFFNRRLGESQIR